MSIAVYRWDHATDVIWEGLSLGAPDGRDCVLLWSGPAADEATLKNDLVAFAQRNGLAFAEGFRVTHRNPRLVSIAAVVLHEDGRPRARPHDNHWRYLS